MLKRALDDACWEVIMLAFHMMNQGARETLFPRALPQADTEKLRALFGHLRGVGLMPPDNARVR